MVRAAIAAGIAFVLALALASCNESDDHKLKGLKIQVQDAYGAKDFHKGLKAAQEGFALSRKAHGERNPNTLYFVQAISEAQLGLRNMRGAISALKQEIDVRKSAGQSEDKLQRRRTLLIKLAEENNDRMTAVDQTVIIAKSIDMGPGKDPQPTYRAETDYPPELYRKRVEGDVEMGFGLTADGTPTNVRVTHATPPDVFNDAAVASFSKWRFTPVIRDGEPVSSSGHHFTLAFRLGRGR
jgi:TonB family protein